MATEIGRDGLCVVLISASTIESRISSLNRILEFRKLTKEEIRDSEDEITL
jgi:hypothetical protein